MGDHSILKPSSFILPVIALAIAGAWLGTQFRAVSSLEQASDLLEKAIASRASDSIENFQSIKSLSITQVTKDKGSLNGKKIAAKFAEIYGSRVNGHTLEMTKLMEHFLAMSNEEIIAVLDEIAVLDLTNESRTNLEDWLIVILSSKAPEIVMTKLSGRIRDGDQSSGWGFLSAMYKWTHNDPTAASRWFDQQIGAGTFDSKSLDGKNATRLEFEGILMTLLLPTDPDAAARRLAALPEDQRSEALSQSSYKPHGEHQAAYVQIIRDQLPEKEQGKALAGLIPSMVKNNGNYTEVAEFLNLIQATPAERTVCVEQAAVCGLQTISPERKVTREDLDVMREWVTTQAPDSTGTVTGRVLANASRNGGNIEFSEAAELALEYHTAAGNDEVLASFLNSQSALQNKEQARVLTENISDPTRRSEILIKLK